MAGDDKLPNMLYAFSVVFSIIPTVAVALRFQARRLTRNRLLWDDWMILLALVFTIATAILIIIGVAAGGGGRRLQRDPDGNPVYDRKYVIFQKTMYAGDLTQLLALGPTKLSVLFLYRRIFGVNGRRFNYVSMVLIIMVATWTIAFFLTNTFQYNPIHTQWAQNPMEMRPAMDLTKMFLSQSYIDVALDVLIISVPIPLVWGLRINLPKKLAISCIFLLGALTVAASVTRTVIQHGVAKKCMFASLLDEHNPDVPYYLSPINYWPLIESALGIVGACLPLLRPIEQVYSFRNIYLLSSRALSELSKLGRSNAQSSNDNGSNNGSLAKLEPEDAKAGGRDRWMKPYDVSALEQTINQESHVEAVPLATLYSKNSSSDGIRIETTCKVEHD